MADFPIATIAGEFLVGGQYGDHSWVDTLGVSAPEVVWCLPIKLAEKVLALKETEITFQPPGGQKTTWKRVVVVKEEATDHPLRRYVKLSDVRWYLPRVNVKRDFNVRSRTGATRILNIPGVPIETLKPLDVTTYAPYSIKDGRTPYSADEILAWIEAYLKTHCTAPTPISFRTAGRSRGQYTPNDIVLDGPGNVALGHAMGLAGGLDMHVTKDGVIELVDAFMGAERKTIEQFCTYALKGRGGPLRLVDMGHVAPRVVNGLYQRECEVRGDAWEKAPSEAALTDAEIGNLPVFRNAIKVTDVSLPYLGETYVAGTYLADADKWFSAVAAKGDGPQGVVTPFSRQTFMDNYLGGGRLYNLFAIDISGAQGPNQLWMSRIGAAYEDFRLTYALNPTFANLCVPGTIKAVRAAMLDPVQGTRQPSPVYVEFCRRPTTQGLQNDKFQGWNGQNIAPINPEPIAITKTYTETFLTNPFALSSATQAPFNATLIDDVVGIFHLIPRKDPWGNVADIIHSLVFDCPRVDLRDVSNGANAFWEMAKLVYTHRMALIFTATPGAAPLHRYPVTAAAALQKLGVSSDAVNANGPDFDIRIGPGVSTARIAWDDGNRINLLKLFNDTNQAESIGQSLTPVNNLELADYAVSAAAVLMASLLNRYEGHASIAFSPSISVLGSLRAVTHTITAKGSFYTTIDCHSVTPPVNPIHLLDASSRQILLRSPVATP